jgi:hypothetical protein
MSPKPQKQNHADVNDEKLEITESPKEIDAFLDRETRVRFRAYELYLWRGQSPGFDLDDWLQAESEIGGEAEVDGGIGRGIAST